jgi:hypothetical protein
MEAQGIAWLFGEDMDIRRLLHFTTLLLCMVQKSSPERKARMANQQMWWIFRAWVWDHEQNEDIQPDERSLNCIAILIYYALSASEGRAPRRCR